MQFPFDPRYPVNANGYRRTWRNIPMREWDLTGAFATKNWLQSETRYTWLRTLAITKGNLQLQTFRKLILLGFVAYGFRWYHLTMRKFYIKL